MKRDYRGLAVLLLAMCVGAAILVFAFLAILDLYNPPQDSKLGHQAMAVGAGAVAGAMSLIGVYLGMGASVERLQEIKKSQAAAQAEIEEVDGPDEEAGNGDQ